MAVGQTAIDMQTLRGDRASREGMRNTGWVNFFDEVRGVQGARPLGQGLHIVWGR